MRDENVRAELEGLGWAVLEVWECQTKSTDLEQLTKLVRAIVKTRARRGTDR